MELSVVCPFYNEADDIETSARTLLERLAARGPQAELVLVDDGSTDGSAELAWRLAAQYPQLRLIRYDANRGRGYALRTGMAEARGRIIVTTEIDLSWGEDIVERLVRALEKSPATDIVIASPHRRGGGYKNVPLHRVWLSRLGNWLIRLLMPGAVTMNTGMTRAYRRAAIATVPLREEEKILHLEVILKAHHFGFRVEEIPAVLAWKTSEQRGARQNPAGLLRVIASHLRFVFMAGALRVCVILGGLMLALSLAMRGFGVAAAAFFVLGIVAHVRARAQQREWDRQRAEMTRAK